MSSKSLGFALNSTDIWKKSKSILLMFYFFGANIWQELSTFISCIEIPLGY